VSFISLSHYLVLLLIEHLVDVPAFLSYFFLVYSFAFNLVYESENCRLLRLLLCYTYLISVFRVHFWFGQHCMGSLSYFATDKYAWTDGLSVFLRTIMSLSCIRINSKIVLDHFLGELLQIELLLLLLNRLLWALRCFAFRLKYLLSYFVVMQLTGFLCLATGCDWPSHHRHR